MFAAGKTSGGAAAGAYQISRSLRFNSADSAYLNRTPASATNRRTWTWSAWVKRSTLGAIQELFDSYWANTDNGYFWVGFTSADAFEVQLYNSTLRTTTQVFRDPSAWYHLVLAIDTTQATAANRVKVYLNGSEITTFSTNNAPTQNLDTAVNYNGAHYIGTFAGSTNLFNGYMTEVNLIDGTQLTPSSFGETNAQTGVWQPKAYSGSYGTNGFYLNFLDNSNTTAATLGKDYSGNGNNWTPNGFSISSGAGNDSLVDSPTSYGTDTGVGGEVRGNYCTLNPLDKSTSGGAAKNGNLDYAATQASWDMIRSTFGMSSGKWYWEVSVNSSSFGITGIAQASVVLQNNYFSAGAWLGYNAANGDKYSGTGGATAYGASWNASNDICGVAFDADAGTLTFYKNGTSQGVAYTSLSGTYFPTHTLYDTSTATLNFGQRAFAYTAPSGFKALCTQNLPTPTIGATSATTADKYFNIKLYTGNGSAGNAQSGLGFQPDFLWFKARSAVRSHALFNAVMTRTFGLASESTNAEYTSIAGRDLASFDSDGFTVGVPENFGSTNAGGDSIVAWAWKANGSGSTNTAGSITSTVSANTTSGFSVVTYTGTGANATVGHGLGVAPSMLIIKRRDSTSNWLVYQISLGNTKGLVLNATQAESTDSTYWNNTSPTSSVFSLGSGGAANASAGTMVAYCFAPVAGYSAFGSYTGNGSADGPFVFTGMRPAYVMIKRTDSTASWYVLDVARNTYNAANLNLYPNLSDSEATFSALDILSNGFKIRNSDVDFNASGGTYIYACFASNPFKYSLAR